MDNHWTGRTATTLRPAVNRQWEGLDEPFEVYPGVVVPPGQYRSPHLAWRTNTDRRKAVFFTATGTTAGFCRATRTT